MVLPDGWGGGARLFVEEERYRRRPNRSSCRRLDGTNGTRVPLLLGIRQRRRKDLPVLSPSDAIAVAGGGHALTARVESRVNQKRLGNPVRQFNQVRPVGN